MHDSIDVMESIRFRNLLSVSVEDLFECPIGLLGSYHIYFMTTNVKLYFKQPSNKKLFLIIFLESVKL